MGHPERAQLQASTNQRRASGPTIERMRHTKGRGDETTLSSSIYLPKARAPAPDTSRCPVPCTDVSRNASRGAASAAAAAAGPAGSCRTLCLQCSDRLRSMRSLGRSGGLQPAAGGLRGNSTCNRRGAYFCAPSSCPTMDTDCGRAQGEVPEVIRGGGAAGATTAPASARAAAAGRQRGTCAAAHLPVLGGAAVHAAVLAHAEGALLVSARGAATVHQCAVPLAAGLRSSFAGARHSRLGGALVVAARHHPAGRGAAGVSGEKRWQHRGAAARWPGWLLAC